MRDGWPTWAKRAWRSMTADQRERARIVWTALADAFDGVLVGTGPLVRRLVDEGRLGHRTTLDTLGVLAGLDLVRVRRAAEGPVLWVPGELLGPDADAGADPTRPAFLAPARPNGSPRGERAQA